MKNYVIFCVIFVQKQPQNNWRLLLGFFAFLGCLGIVAWNSYGGGSVTESATLRYEMHSVTNRCIIDSP